MTVGLFGACNSGGPTVSGQVVDYDRCGSQEMVGKQLTIRDGDGGVVGTATLSDVAEKQTRYEDVCRIEADYSVAVDKAEFYEIGIEGIEAPAQPVSFDELERAGFEHDLMISTGPYQPGAVQAPQSEPVATNHR